MKQCRIVNLQIETELAMVIIDIKGLTKNYALGKTTVHALRGIDLSISKGDLVSIMGPSGSGKTTLLNVIGCIDLATSGTVKVSGMDLNTMPFGNPHSVTQWRHFSRAPC